MKKILYLLITIVAFVVCINHPLRASIPERLKGNWFELEGNGYWKYSFSDHFVIANNTFWRIEHYTEQGKSVYLQLRLNQVKNMLHLTFIDDSTIVIGGKRYKQAFSPVKRKAVSKDIKLQPGKALVMGYVKDFKMRYNTIDRAVFTVDDFVLQTQKPHFADIDSLTGRFETTIELNGPQDVYMTYNPANTFPRIFLSPGDTLIVYINANTFGFEKDDTQFMGRYADICYDMYYMEKPYKASLPSFKAYNKALSGEPEEYYQFRASYREREMMFLEEYCAKQECSNVFKTWFKKNADIEFFKELLNFSWKSLKYSAGSQTTLSKEAKAAYYNLFIHSINEEDSLYEISSLYARLLNSLSQQMINFGDKEIFKNEFREIIAVIYSHRSKLTAAQISYLKVITQKYSEAKQIPGQEKELWWKLVSKYDNEIKIAKQRAYFDWLLAKIAKLDNEKLKDLFMCNYYHHWAIEEMNTALLDYGFEKLKARIKNKEYFNKISKEYFSVKAKEEKFNVIDTITSGTDSNGDQLIKDILKKNTGKAVFIDFWATWCGPCLSDFKQMKEIKQKFIGKDITFVYLCSESTQQDWQRMLKQYDLTGEHYLLTTKQYYDLQEKFSIHGFPAYLLINKQGKISKDIPRPDDVYKLIQILSEATQE